MRARRMDSSANIYITETGCAGDVSLRNMREAENGAGQASTTMKGAFFGIYEYQAEKERL